MKDTINYDGFVSGILQVRPDNFTILGLRTLYDYFEQLEQDTGEQIEFDPIAICCEFAEYDNLAEFQNDYGEEYISMEMIEDATTVLRNNSEGGSFVIVQF